MNTTARQEASNRQGWWFAHYELVVVVMVPVCTLILLVITDASHALHDWLDQNEAYRTFDVFFTFVVVAIVLGWFGYRRSRQHQLSVKLLNDAIEVLPNGFVLYDADDRLVVCNEHYRATYPACASLMHRGTKFEDIIRASVAAGEISAAGTTSEDHEAWINKRLLQHRSPQREIEQRLSNGRFLRIVERPTYKGGVVGYRIDITDLKNAEEKLIQHRNKLESLVEARTEEVKEKARKLERALQSEQHHNALQKKFVSLVSHEFRTPISIIDGSVQRLMRKKDVLEASEVEARVNTIRSAIKRMTDLMDATLYATRLDEGGIKLNLTSCDIGLMLKEVCARQSEISPGHQIECSVSGLTNEIIGDEMLLDQVFTNLLSNAVKYSPGSPLIKVKAWIDEGRAIISVSDQGRGISAEDLPYMFGRFFRGKTADGIQGTGIGLSMAKEFVNLHGGSISVDSQEGEGAAFTVLLPVNNHGS